MSKKFFILLEDFSRLPTAEVGQICKSISKLVSSGINVPQAICISSSTLKLISQANNTNAKVFKIIQETDFNSSLSKNKSIAQLKHVIAKQQIPKELSLEFLHIYHKILKSSYVSVQNSSLIGFKDILVENIKGDVNVVEVILEVWAKSVVEAFRQINSKTQTTDKILYPTPILVQQQIDSEISGVALTFDESDGDKKRFTIKSLRGIINDNLDQASTYTVDSRTFNIIKKVKKLQKRQFNRALEHLQESDINSTKQNLELLSDAQIKDLTKIISKLARLSLSQLKIEWGLQQSVFFIHGVKETSYINKKSDRSTKTIKKVYVSISKNQDKNILEKYGDGVSILNSGHLLSLLGNHPLHVAKSSQKKLLTSAISSTIKSYISGKSHHHLIYRTQNLTSEQLSKLNFSTNFEIVENNPYLGMRGASKILAQPRLFDLEIDIIRNLLEETENRISLLLPFVRSAGELSQLVKIIEKSGLMQRNRFDIWLELSTPDNIFNLNKYPISKISGLVLNTKSIYGLMLGVDPDQNNEISRYHENNETIIELVKLTTEKLKNLHVSNPGMTKKDLLVDLSEFSSGVIKSVINQNIEGIIVNPDVTAIAKKCIINEEEMRILIKK